MNTRLASPARGVVLILLAGLSVGAWAVHVFALASLADLRRTHREVSWAVHATTVVTAIPCVVTVAVGWWWLRRTTTAADEGSPTGRTVFLCWMALFVGLANLLLIVGEDAYASVLHSYA